MGTKGFGENKGWSQNRRKAFFLSQESEPKKISFVVFFFVFFEREYHLLFGKAKEIEDKMKKRGGSYRLYSKPREFISRIIYHPAASFTTFSPLLCGTRIFESLHGH